MAKLSLAKGTTSKLVHVFIQDASQTSGTGLSGLLFNSAGLTAYYYREGEGAPVLVPLVTMTLGTWTSGGFIAIHNTNMKGWYQIGLPDAMLASGANSVTLHLEGAINMVALPLEIELTSVDNQNATSFGVTRIDTTISSRSTFAGGAVASVTGNVGGNVNGSVNSVVTDVGITQAAADKVWLSTSRSLTAPVTLTTGERDSVALALLNLADGVETNLTVKRALQLIAAAVSGLAAGFPTSPDTFSSADVNLAGTSIVGTKTRISATTDTNGNRTAITVDFT